MSHGDNYQPCMRPASLRKSRPPRTSGPAPEPAAPADGMESLRERLAAHARLSGPLTLGAVVDVLGVDWEVAKAVLDHKWFDLDCGRYHLTAAAYSWLEAKGLER